MPVAIGYHGIVRGRVVELPGDVRLPEGTQVEVLVREQDQLTPGGHKKGTMGALREYLRTPSHVTTEDVDELMRIIKDSRLPTDYRGIFDDQGEAE